MEKINAVYKITNTITNDFYIGSSKDIKRRWMSHKIPSTWKRFPNNPMYQDMKRYGVDKFEFEILAEVEAEKLKETEQQFIEKLKPTYNQMNAKGWNIERRKEYMKEYSKSDKFKETQKKYRKSNKGKEAHKKSQNKYNKSNKGKETQKKYRKSNKGKEAHKEYQNKYNKSNKGKETKRKANNKYKHQLCSYNGEILTLNALYQRFQKAGIEHPVQEAKKYLLKEQQN